MYTRFFGLIEKPFAITPDPRYLFLSARHAEALAHLLYGIEDAGGFVQLTGEVGTGKTTMVRSLLVQLPAQADVALILNPRVTPEEFLRAIADELHVALPAAAHGSVKAIVDALNAYLLEAHARGRRVVVIVDEAQQLSADVLEQVRLLTNLETATQKLLQIILVGQPELREVLTRNDLRQLAQRITGRYHLEPLSRAETTAYVRHRLQVAGATTEVFTRAALVELHRRSRGVPRLVNVIADRALLGAYTREQHRVGAALVRHAAGEVQGRSLLAPPLAWTLGAVSVVAVAILALALHALGGAERGVAPSAARAPAGVIARGTPAPPAASAAAPAAASAAAPAAPAARPVASPPPAPSLEEFLSAQGPATGTDAAFAHLFGLWNVPFDTHGARPCEQAATAGLECYTDRGTVAQLGLFNRPAILSLVGRDGVEHQVVVTALDDAHARLEAGAAALTVSLAELDRVWYGQYLLLWHPPLPLPHLLKPGQRGPEVRWLRQSLAAARGEKVHGASDAFDAALGLEVEDFQRRHRLGVDGLAGLQTQVLLDSLAGVPGAPTLRAGGA